MKYVQEEKAYEMYEEMLDGLFGPVEIGNLTFDASRVIKELAPDAYADGFDSWCDREGITMDGKETVR